MRRPSVPRRDLTPPASSPSRSRSRVLAALAAATLAVAPTPAQARPLGTAAESLEPPAPALPLLPGDVPPWPEIVWRHSRVRGLPFSHGRLVDGVQLPPYGEHFVSWDLILHRFPDRPWRQWGSDKLIRTILTVLAGYARDHPEAPRVLIADLSRPHGGYFGKEYGGLGHASHQNGLDADILYPRYDGIEQPAPGASWIDPVLSQDLVSRFVAAGAQFVFVGTRTHLHGPRKVVETIPFHNDHFHVRLYPPRR